MTGPTPSPLEDLLAERIALCWLTVHYAELDLTQARQREATLPALAEHARKRLDSAHRRYLYAIKQLAIVRKLLTPAVSPLRLAGVTVHELSPAGRKRTARLPSESPQAVRN